MIHRFIQHLQQFVQLDEQDEEEIKSSLKVQHFQKKEMLLSEGQISKAFFFNLSGFVRLFYSRAEGEKTAYFYPPGCFISAYESFVRQQPSQLNLQVTEDSSLVVISIESAAKLLQHSPKFSALARIAMEDELIAHQRMIAALLTLSPEERYLQLLQKSPEIFQKVPQHYIASYIGVNPESLSRIKKRAMAKNHNQSQ